MHRNDFNWKLQQAIGSDRNTRQITEFTCSQTPSTVDPQRLGAFNQFFLVSLFHSQMLAFLNQQSNSNAKPGITVPSGTGTGVESSAMR
ncbi:MAG: hypothetical protein EAZ88_09720 [Oscillatoriales cyanobacterium]|nr:MAG: hypothetical protein EAZ88_09720 [Oscillatoriales cyanobacterium]